MDVVKQLFSIRSADVRAQNPKFHSESLRENEIGLKILDEIENEAACFSISDLTVSGKDLAAIGIKPSPEMTKLWMTRLKIQNRHFWKEPRS